MSEIIERQKKISVITDLSREHESCRMKSAKLKRRDTHQVHLQVKRAPTLRGEINCMFTNNKQDHAQRDLCKAVFSLKQQLRNFLSTCNVS